MLIDAVVKPAPRIELGPKVYRTLAPPWSHTGMKMNRTIVSGDLNPDPWRN